MTLSFQYTWNLDCFYEGGSSSTVFLKLLDRLEEDLSGALSIEQLESIFASLKECDSYILCLQSQNTQDERASQLRARLISLEAAFQKIYDRLGKKLLETNEKHSFYLEECRESASQKLSLEQEALITQLSIDGYHAWYDLYAKCVGEMQIDGRSIGQTENQLSHPSRVVRTAAFTSFQKAWKEKEGIFATILNHLAGFRLQVYDLRGWKNALFEPLFNNRMSAETLNTMWNVVDEMKAPLVDFLKLKASLLKLDKLSWCDMEAPLPALNEENIPYEEAVGLIVEAFGAFDPKMAEFAKRACSEGWVEGEDRAGKRPGGFCTPFPKQKQSRIFMTYSGSMTNVLTLAHELGHAYHNQAVFGLSSFDQDYKMNIAETASTFAEHLLFNLLEQRAKTKEEKIAILVQKNQRSVAFLMNIHARFLFETEFYKKREKGFVVAEELNAMMLAAQQKAFCNGLREWHPHFWASKLHFYFTGSPFYNFPYTFGDLFSLGLFARWKKEGSSFVEKYNAILRESGQMKMENLAVKHLAVHLNAPDFWIDAVGEAIKDVESLKALL